MGAETPDDNLYREGVEPRLSLDQGVAQVGYSPSKIRHGLKRFRTHCRAIDYANYHMHDAAPWGLIGSLDICSARVSRLAVCRLYGPAQATKPDVNWPTPPARINRAPRTPTSAQALSALFTLQEVRHRPTHPPTRAPNQPPFHPHSCSSSGGRSRTLTLMTTRRGCARRRCRPSTGRRSRRSSSTS